MTETTRHTKECLLESFVVHPRSVWSVTFDQNMNCLSCIKDDSPSGVTRVSRQTLCEDGSFYKCVRSHPTWRDVVRRMGRYSDRDRPTGPE